MGRTLTLPPGCPIDDRDASEVHRSTTPMWQHSPPMKIPYFGEMVRLWGMASHIQGAARSHSTSRDKVLSKCFGDGLRPIAGAEFPLRILEMTSYGFVPETEGRAGLGHWIAQR
jgi:hypothetical protein